MSRPIELDDYGPDSHSNRTMSAHTPTTASQGDAVSDPLLAHEDDDGHSRFDSHSHFPSTPPLGSGHTATHDDTGSPSLVGRSHPYQSRHRSRSRTNGLADFLWSSRAGSSSSTSHYRKVPLLCVCLIGLPTLLLTLIYGVIRGAAPNLLPEPLGGGKNSEKPSTQAGLGNVPGETLAQKCVCGSPDGTGTNKQDTAGERTCDVYGKHGLLRSRLHEGTGNRMRAFINRAQTGQQLKVGIMGGSVSACHGVHPSPDWPAGDPSGPGCYSTLFAQWLQQAFPPFNGQPHSVVNGAIGGMDSSYYAFCGTHHIPTDADLVVIEFDVNDQSNRHYREFFDQLLRVVLELPNQPAVVILGAWSPSVAQDQGYGDPQLTHLPIAHYYDVPYVSMKRLVWNHYLRFPLELTRSFWQSDGLHPNARGHRILADLLIAYLESQACQYQTLGTSVAPKTEWTIASTDEYAKFIDIGFPFVSPRPQITGAEPGWEETFNQDAIDRMAYEHKWFVEPIDPLAIPFTPIDQPLRDVVDPTVPDRGSASHLTSLAQPQLFCADANDPVNPMNPTASDGWRVYVWKNEKHYWLSDTPGATIRVDIKVSQGRVAVYYFKSKTVAGGVANCWVDDNEAGAVKLEAYWDRQYNVATVEYIDEKVTPGDHFVSCQILDESSNPVNATSREFRLVAIMAT